MVRTIQTTNAFSLNQINFQNQEDIDKQEFLYEIELNERMVYRRRRNAMTLEEIEDIHQFIKASETERKED